MKKIVSLLGMITLTCLTVHPSLAETPQMQVKEKPQLNQTLKKPQAVNELKPMQKPIKLDQAAKMRTVAPKLVLPVHFEQLASQYHELAGKAQEYEVGVAMMPEIQKACAEKSYSVQDQAAAGCNGNETLNQCMEKLVRHCIANYAAGGGISWGGINIGGTEVAPGGSTPSFSTESFRKAAEETAAKARALSQKLQQYASQADRNAAAWK
ncbi:MAG: hypothetical protein R2940_16895 [Syntrophotaleaceae bacterium]